MNAHVLHPLLHGDRYRVFTFVVFLAAALLIFPAPQRSLGQSTSARLPLRFDHFTIENGLSQSVVWTIFQDARGFLWFGTEDGLNRYDGYTCRVFYSDPDDSSTITMSNIYSIEEDFLGNIWIGTQFGLNMFDPRTEKFTRFSSRPEDSTSISNNRIRVILEAPDSTLWIGTRRGLNRLIRDRCSPEQYRFERFLTGAPDSSAAGWISTLFADSRDRVWVGVAGQGVLEIVNTPAGKPQFRKPFSEKITRQAPEWVIDMCEDKNGRFWLGTPSAGLFRLSVSDSMHIDRFIPATCATLSDGNIRAVHCDHHGNIWVATQFGGLNRLDVSEVDKEHPRFTSYDNDPYDPGSISTTDILSIHEDRSGVLWFGTYGAGANKLNPLETYFMPYRNTAEEAVSREHQRIWTLIEDHAGIVWLGTDGGGVYNYDRSRKHFSPFLVSRINPDLPLLRYVTAVFEDSRHDLWIGTYGQGVFRYPRGSGNPDECGFLPGVGKTAVVPSITEDRNCNVWIGTTAGLHRWERDTGKISLFTHDIHTPGSIANNQISALTTDSAGNLWIGTSSGGLCLLKAEELQSDTPAFYRYRHDRENEKSIGSDYIRALCADSNGYIWAGTHGRGVSCYHPEDKTFIHYTTGDGLSNNTVVGVLEDNRGDIWFSTHNGLSKLSVETGTITNYFTGDGLQNNEFLRGSYFKNSSGELFFGGISGFNIFMPEKIQMNPYPPQVVITDLQVYNKSVPPGQQLHGMIPLAAAITYSDEATLSYKDNTVSFEFAALHFAVPEKNSYAYRLSGVERDWNMVKSRRFVTYSRLRPGRYTFQVKAANNDGVWNETGATVQIRIVPPFWMTGIFRISVILLAGALLLAAVRKELREMREKREALEERVREKTAAAEELTSALDEVERLKNRLEAENTYLQDEIKLDHNFANIITRNRRMRHIMGQIEKVSRTDSTVLILGESGTGKELVARAIHGISNRKDRPLMKVDCASLPPNLIESELFGHEKGAYTGAHTKKIGRIELADGGTVFLDEIGEVPASLQAKLLRFLQDGVVERIGNPQPISVDVRIIAATNRDLPSMIRDGSFREDLFYRLNVFPIDLPPLRERGEDIPLLVQHFCEKYSGKFGKQIEQIPKSVADRLSAYLWPGNIRELENVVERAVILSPGKKLVVGDWFLHDTRTSGNDDIIPLEEMERTYIIKVLEYTGWRVSGENGAARLLRLKPTTLESRMKKLGIDRH